MTREIADDLLRGEAAEESIWAMEHLAAARREGKHLVFAERDVLEDIIQRAAGHLTPKSLGVYRHVLNGLPQLGGIAQAVKRRVLIFGPESELKKCDAEHGVEIHVPSSVASLADCVSASKDWVIDDRQ